MLTVWLDEGQRSFSRYQGIYIALQCASGLLTNLATSVYRQTSADKYVYCGDKHYVSRLSSPHDVTLNVSIDSDFKDCSVEVDTWFSLGLVYLRLSMLFSFASIVKQGMQSYLNCKIQCLLAVRFFKKM